jgi:hypothetical protein
MSSSNDSKYLRVFEFKQYFDERKVMLVAFKLWKYAFEVKES